MTNQDSPAIGIYLGTTYSSVAVERHNRVEVLTNEQGNRTTPSCVAFTDSECLVGESAENQSSANPSNTIFGIMRLIGRRCHEDSVQSDIWSWPFRVIAGPDGLPLIIVQYRGSEQIFSPEQILARILTRMREIAELNLSTKVSHAVLTVPACFNDLQRKATEEAAKIAGLNVVGLVVEPIAAALAYGLGKMPKKGSDDETGEKKNALVFDLGGGTLNVTMVSMQDGRLEIKATGSDAQLGGTDFDNPVVQYLVEVFQWKYGKDVTRNAQTLSRLRTACDRAMGALYAGIMATFDVKFVDIYERMGFFSRMTRPVAEGLEEDLFDRCMEIVEQILHDSRMEKSEVDEVILVGGSTRITKVQEMLKEFFEKETLCDTINPEVVVAYGAAIEAAKKISRRESSMTHQNNPTVGIYLGNTYSCVAVKRRNRVEVVSNDQGNRTTPAYVAFTDTEHFVGERAKEQSIHNPSNTVFGIMRLIGRRFDEESVQRFIPSLPFRVAAGPNGCPMIVVQYKGREQRFSPEEILAKILTKMREIAEAYLCTRVRNAVVTVPTYFNDSQRRATKNAAIIAKLKVLQLVDEEIAAACRFYRMRSSSYHGKEEEEEGNILVFDLGSDTFNVAVVSTRDGNLQLKAKAGDADVGGEEFEIRMANCYAAVFARSYGEDMAENAGVRKKLRTACEKAKRDLYLETEAFILVEYLYGPIHFIRVVTRMEFEVLNFDLFERFMEMVKQCLRDSETDKSQIDEVILVGGSTRVAKVQEMLEEFFGRESLCRSANPDEVVAQGAAIMAAEMTGGGDGNPQDLVLVDVPPPPLGVDTRGGEITVLIPNRQRLEISAAVDSITSVEVKVFEGEPTMSMYNNLLGQVEIDGIEPAPASVLLVDISFCIDVNGMLTVTAERGSSGRGNVSWKPSAAEIERMKEVKVGWVFDSPELMMRLKWVPEGLLVVAV